MPQHELSESYLEILSYPIHLPCQLLFSPFSSLVVLGDLFVFVWLSSKDTHRHSINGVGWTGRKRNWAKPELGEIGVTGRKLNRAKPELGENGTRKMFSTIRFQNSGFFKMNPFSKCFQNFHCNFHRLDQTVPNTLSVSLS